MQKILRIIDDIIFAPLLLIACVAKLIAEKLRISNSSNTRLLPPKILRTRFKHFYKEPTIRRNTKIQNRHAIRNRNCLRISKNKFKNRSLNH